MRRKTCWPGKFGGWRHETQQAAHYAQAYSIVLLGIVLALATWAVVDWAV